MKHNLAKVALLAGFAFLSQLQWVQAGPFGFSEGMTPAETRANETGWIENAPQPDPYFNAYRADFSKKSGLCRVAAGTHYFTDDPNGERVRKEFAALREKMDSLYGASTLVDETLPDWTPGSSWSEDIIKSHRRYLARWKPTDPKSELLSAAAVAIGSDPQTTRIFVLFDFKNYGDCVAENKAPAIPEPMPE